MAEEVKAPTESPRVSDAIVKWLDEISMAKRREKNWRKDGRRVKQIYDGGKKDSIPFNILYSNTETLLPALYNSQPRPVVQRRFKDEDPLGKMSSDAGRRVLEYLVDTNSEEYASFDEVMISTVLDALLPGRGACRVKYDAKIVQLPGGPEGKSTPMVSWELVCFDTTKWDRLIIGFAHKWKDVPWIAYEHQVTPEEAVELFGTKAKELTFSAAEKSEDDEDDQSRPDDKQTDENRKVALVYEIWDRIGDRKVRFVSPQYQSDYLKVDDDPLELTGFFPTPEPLRFLKKSNDLMPTALYALYENQATELNRITTRINRIVEALKIRGAYDSTLGSDIENILKKDDNELIGAENVAALQASGQGALEKAIWLMPIDKLIVVVQQLIVARQQCKQIIYEITGISDILRGQSVASETATAQEIKNQWGTLRLKRLQREVQRYARDVLRITLEVAASKFNERTWAAMTGLPFTTSAQKQQIMMQAQTMVAVGQPVPPQVSMQLQQPGWPEVLKMLQDDTQRQYRIDIETNSTVDVEATEDQKMMGEVLTAIGQFVQGISPLIASGTMPFQVAQSMLLAIVRRYRFGTEIEEQIKMMQPPKPPDDGKQKEMEAKVQMEREKHQMSMKEGEQKLAFEKEKQQMELMAEREKLALEKELAIFKHRAEIAKLKLEAHRNAQKLNHETEMASLRIQEARSKPKKGESRAAT